MYYEKKKSKKSLKWLIPILIIAFVAWVMFDDTDKGSETNQILEVQLPQ